MREFVLFIALVDFIFGILDFIPLLNCVTIILQLLFWIYALYLFTLLISTLFSIPKLTAFAAISIGWILELIYSLLVIVILFYNFNIDVGMTELMEMTSAFSS